MANAIEASLEHLNTNRHEAYMLSFNPVLRAYCVVQVLTVGGDTFLGQVSIRPYTNNHNTAAEALRDAIKLKDFRSLNAIKA